MRNLSRGTHVQAAALAAIGTNLALDLASSEGKGQGGIDCQPYFRRDIGYHGSQLQNSPVTIGIAAVQDSQ